MGHYNIDVIFHENTDDEISNYDVWHTPYDNDVHVKIDIDDEQEHEQQKEQVQEKGESSVDTPTTPTPQKRRNESEENGGPQRKSSRTIQIPSRYKDYTLMTQIMNVVEPISYEQAKNHKEWNTAMNGE